MSSDREPPDTDSMPLWWFVLVLAVVFSIGVFAGGVLGLNAERDHSALRSVREPLLTVFDAPRTLKNAMESAADPTADLRAPEQRYGDESGFTYGYDVGEWDSAPYLLINRYDGDRQRSVSDLVDLRSQELLHTWEFDSDPFIADLDFESRFTDLVRDKNTTRFQNVHALLHDDGSIVTLSHESPLMKFGPCGGLDWASTGNVFHHSIEKDGEGFYWVPIHFEPPTTDYGGPMFMDDGIARVSSEGEVVYTKSMSQALEENGLGVYLRGFGPDTDDPLHLNDIQPVLEDGEIWRRGDLWLSMRDRSLVALYRPETNEILWWSFGPWSYQHDVDIIDERRITVFDNASVRSGPSSMRPEDYSGKWIVDVVDNEFTQIQPETFEALDIRVPYSGLSDLLPDGKVLVEESPHGRLLVFDEEGNVLLSYVNRAQDGNAYALSWSRLVDRETGDTVKALINEGMCDD